MALLRTVETDLRSLSMEARRRFPEVKEAAERALQRLRKQSEIAKRALSSTTQTSIDVRHTRGKRAARLPTMPPDPPELGGARSSHRLHRTATCTARGETALRASLGLTASFDTPRQLAPNRLK